VDSSTQRWLQDRRRLCFHNSVSRNRLNRARLDRDSGHCDWSRLQIDDADPTVVCVDKVEISGGVEK